MATVTDLKILLDLYGVGVRAGVLTPQMQDEEYFRGIADLPEMSAETKAAWAEEGGVRRPITLAALSGDQGPVQITSEDQDAS